MIGPLKNTCRQSGSCRILIDMRQQNSWSMGKRKSPDDISEAVVKSSVVMGADYYETDADRAEDRRLGQPDIGIGDGAVIEDALIDKKARIGRNVTIRNSLDRPDSETEDWAARDGLIVVPNSAIIPDNTEVSPILWTHS